MSLSQLLKFFLAILDGILIVNEIVDDARSLKKDLLLFKVDFEKTYDKVDWWYLEDVMVKMNFPTLWPKWILEGVTTTMTSVLVNDSSTKEFKMERGLRQGNWEMSVPYHIWYRIHNLTVIWCEHMVSAMHRVSITILKPWPPLIRELNLQSNIS